MPQYPARLRTETMVTGKKMQVRILSGAPLRRTVFLDSAGLGVTVRPNFRGLAQSGSAPALGAGGRRFESYIPDHFLLV